MPRILSNEFLLKTLFELVVIGGGIWVIEFYLEYKYAPTKAAEILKKENFLNAKKDAFFEAIGIANKYMANVDYGSTDALTGNKIDPKFLHKHKPDLSNFELDINSAYSKLMTFTSDTSILSAYFRIFVTPPNEKHIPIAEMAKFLKAIRKDLGNDVNLPEEYKLLYIVMPSNQDSIN